MRKSITKWFVLLMTCSLLLRGNFFYDNTVRAVGTTQSSNGITRAEFFSMVNDAFQFTTPSAITYTDVSRNKWYYSVIQKATYAGYVFGDTKNKLYPEKKITREEVAVLIQRIVKVDSGVSALKFTDAYKISSWSKASIGALSEANIMSGYPNGQFKPQANITKAEVQALLVKAINKKPTLYVKAGTFGPTSNQEIIEGNVAIRTNGVVLQNLHIKGDLYISKEVGEGNVVLNDVYVDGHTFVRGGGKNSIHITGGSYNKVIVQQTSSNQVRIVGMYLDGLEVVISDNAKGEKVILEGVFDQVSLEAPDLELQTQGLTKINRMDIANSSVNARIVVEEMTTVKKMVINSPVGLFGYGIIGTAQINANQVTYEKAPSNQIVAENVSVQPTKYVAPVVIAVTTPTGVNVGVVTTPIVSNPIVTNPNAPISDNNNNNNNNNNNQNPVVPGETTPAAVAVVTTRGALTVTGYAHIIAETENGYNVHYKSNENLENGSIRFTLPEAFKISDTSLVCLEGEDLSYTIRELGTKAVVENNGHTLTLYNIPYIGMTDVTLIYSNVVNHTIEDIRFSCQADKDGVGTQYLPSSGTENEEKTISVFQGYRVSGTISLPANEVAPVLGVNLEVRLVSRTHEIYSQKIKFEEGSSRCNYSILVPAGNYALSYHDQYGAGYINYLEYSDSGMTSDPTEAATITLPNNKLNQYDIQVVRGVRVKGQITLPEGKVAPVGGVKVTIMASGNENASRTLYILEGQSTTHYEFLLDKGQYDLCVYTENEAYVKFVFYTSSGAVADDTLAEVFDTSITTTDHMDICMMTGNVISGTVSLPTGYVAPVGGISVFVRISPTQYTTVSIPEGQNSVNYQLRATNANVRISFAVVAPLNNTIYYSQVYYNNTGTVKEYDDATILTIQDADIQNINAELILN